MALIWSPKKPWRGTVRSLSGDESLCSNSVRYRDSLLLIGVHSICHFCFSRWSYCENHQCGDSFVEYVATTSGPKGNLSVFLTLSSGRKTILKCIASFSGYPESRGVDSFKLRSICGQCSPQPNTWNTWGLSSRNPEKSRIEPDHCTTFMSHTMGASMPWPVTLSFRNDRAFTSLKTKKTHALQIWSSKFCCPSELKWLLEKSAK